MQRQLSSGSLRPGVGGYQFVAKDSCRADESSRARQSSRRSRHRLLLLNPEQALKPETGRKTRIGSSRSPGELAQHEHPHGRHPAHRIEVDYRPAGRGRSAAAGTAGV